MRRVDENKIMSIEDFKDGQTLYLLSRGSIIVEDKHLGGGRGFRNGEPTMHPYSRVSLIPELMRKHGFFIDREKYYEYLKNWEEKNTCKCCNQTLPHPQSIKTDGIYYLK